MKLDKNRLLYFIIISSFFVAYFQYVSPIVSYLLSIIVFFTTVFYYGIKYDKIIQKHNIIYGLAGISFLIFGVVAISHSYLYRSYLFFATIILLVMIYQRETYSINNFLKAINYTYLLYVLLSILVYSGLIPAGREVNAFPVTLFGYNLITLYGFHGSTASIDSYSALVLLFNLLFNKNQSKHFYILLSALCVFLTFRSTPILIFVVPFLFILIIKLFGRKTIYFLNAGLFVSFAVPYIFDIIFHNEILNATFHYATTGRATLWNAMIIEYSDFAKVEMLLGVGNTDTFSVTAWQAGITNTHNTFFTYLISYGAIIFMISYILITKKMTGLNNKSLIIVYGCLVSFISNGQMFSFYGMHIVLIILYFTYFSNNIINRQ